MTKGSQSNESQNGGLPPFRVGDKFLFMGEISFILASQLIVGLYKTVTSPNFPGWLTPVTTDTLTSSNLANTLLSAATLITAWIIAGWLTGSLSRRLYISRLKDTFDITWQNWISAANVYIVYKLLYAFITRSEVVDVQIPLISASLAVFIWRVIYFDAR
jgi:hypothetical protein